MQIPHQHSAFCFPAWSPAVWPVLPCLQSQRWRRYCPAQVTSEAAWWFLNTTPPSDTETRFCSAASVFWRPFARWRQLLYVHKLMWMTFLAGFRITTRLLQPWMPTLQILRTAAMALSHCQEDPLGRAVPRADPNWVHLETKMVGHHTEIPSLNSDCS